MPALHVYLLAEVESRLDDDLEGFLRLSKDLGCSEVEEEYLSKCYLCIDIKKHLREVDEFRELKPSGFYDHLEKKDE